VQEHEHPGAVPPRLHQDLVEIAVHERAVQREVDDPRAARRVVARAAAAGEQQ
jgi:hypothetical protein